MVPTRGNQEWDANVTEIQAWRRKEFEGSVGATGGE